MSKLSVQFAKVRLVMAKVHTGKRRRENEEDLDLEEELESEPGIHISVNGDHKRPDAAIDEEEDEEERLPAVTRSKLGRGARKGHECPYLDTISRQNLDFDFEKCCSVSLTKVNVYVCLVCGKYFQGRGPSTYAYTHALEAGHHLFMKLDNGRVYCLPEMYEVQDRSFSDIQYVLNPAFTREEAEQAENASAWCRALDGSEYMPGLVGLNNMRANDYANVIYQALNRVPPIRIHFLTMVDRDQSRPGVTQLIWRFGELYRKMWNSRAFKGHVSPHEVMQAVMTASNKRFLIDKQSDPVEFLSWLINSLHMDLTAGKRKAPSVITETLQGELRIITEAGTGKAHSSTVDISENVPFFMLMLDLPPAPLFKDSVLDKVTIPQVPIQDLLRKYDGTTVQDDPRTGRRRLQITRLPKFLVLHVKRFVKNQFFVEKNPTIVNFPVKGLDIASCIPNATFKGGSIYDLVANVVHEGRVADGSYKVHVLRRGEGLWYEVQDLQVTEVLPQVVALSEAYLQIYQLRNEVN